MYVSGFSIDPGLKSAEQSCQPVACGYQCETDGISTSTMSPYRLILYLVCYLSMKPPSCLQVSLPTQYNDQQQAPVGALSGALGRIQANRPLRELREIAKGVTKQLPEAFQVRLACHATLLLGPAHLHGMHTVTI